MEQTETLQTLSTREKMKLFLEVTGDMNPAHHDLEYCLKKGFKDVVVPGMFSASALSRFAPASNKIGFDFRDFVYPDDELTSTMPDGVILTSYVNQLKQVVVELYDNFGNRIILGSNMEISGKNPEINKAVTLDNLNKFKLATGIEDNQRALRMFSASLIPAALTSHYCTDGIYRSQKLIFYNQPLIRDTFQIYSKVASKKGTSDKGFIYQLLNFCYSDKKLIFKGMATCLCDRDL